LTFLYGFADHKSYKETISLMKNCDMGAIDQKQKKLLSDTSERIKIDHLLCPTFRSVCRKTNFFFAYGADTSCNSRQRLTIS